MLEGSIYKELQLRKENNGASISTGWRIGKRRMLDMWVFEGNTGCTCIAAGAAILE